MELRRLSLCLAFLMVAALSHSSEARHSTTRREASNDFYQDDVASDNENELNDEAGDEDGDALENISIITKPESYNVPAGQGVRLECKLDTESPGSSTMVHWKKGNVTLIIMGSSTLDANKYTLNGTDLVIQSLTAADSGAYQCLVEGQKIPPMVEHRVAVYEPPKIIAVTASDGGKPAYGADLILTCTATGNPTPKILWSKTNGTMNERLGEGPELVIRSVKDKDSGKYLCYAMVDKGAAAQAIEVVVQKKHHIHPHKTVINSAIGVEAVMQCSIYEEGPFTISWYKGGQRLESSLYTVQGSHSNLTITPQSDADFGTYTCQADSVSGHTHKRSIVLVERPLVQNLEADGQKLAWTVHSHQPLKNIEIQFIDTNNGNLTVLPVSVPEYKTHEYDFSYTVDPAAVRPGNYHVLVKVENTKGISENNEQIIFEQVEPDQVQTAQMPWPAPGAAHSQHPTTALISTVLMYLLVRMM